MFASRRVASVSGRLKARQRNHPSHRSSRRSRPLAVEWLEDRRLLSGGRALFDAPWRAYDTGTFPEAFAPTSIAVGNLDRDGDTDVVGQASSGVSVLLNQGDGSYGPRGSPRTSPSASAWKEGMRDEG